MSTMNAPLAGDTVIYQNWLMKRSQLTRVFKRRFTILTANGKLFSFRKADLSKPDTLRPENASLVWDIRGAFVEPATNMGKHTWVVRPSPASSLREEIYLRTCTASPNESCRMWMLVMCAVAKNNLTLLYDDLSTLTLSTDLHPKPNCVLFAEIDGTLYPLPPGDSIEVSIPVRSANPGSCLLLLGFSPGSENPDAVSVPIPRYRFHKSHTTLPWTVQRPLQISLRSTAGHVTSTGSILLSIDEGLRDYVKPLESGICETEAFDFGLFKFQIRRLIRIIDKLGEFQKHVSAVLEWENPTLSLAWLLYLSVVLLLFPRHVLVIVPLHFAYYSLSKSRDFVYWWKDSFVRQYVTKFRLEINWPDLESQDISKTSPVHPRVAANRPTSPHASTSDSTRAKMKEAATNAILHVSNVIASKVSPPALSALRPEIWENQRRNIGGSQFSASNLSVFDRSRWSDESGRIPLDPPSSADWRIDIDAEKSDDNGWSYNTRWGASSDWHAAFNSWDFVRRRRWVPSTLHSPPLDVNSPPANLTPSPLLESTESAFPAPLSSLMTVGAEYGTLQDDYDETNVEAQPKLASFGSMFHEFKSTAARAQLSIGEICTDIERWLSIFSWRDELVSTVATTALLGVVLLLLIVPVNLLAFILIVSLFHIGYRRNRWKRIAIESILTQHVSPLFKPGTSPNNLSGLEAHKVCLSINKRTGLNLTQKLLAQMTSQNAVATWVCSNSAAFSKYRKWMKRDWIENFLDHVPPEVSTELQVFLADIQTESTTAFPPVPRSSASSDESHVELSVEPASLISETL